MKKSYLNMMWLMVAALILASCSDDDDPIIPKLSLTADAIEISETATSALLVKVNADAPLETAYTVGIALSGTAVEGVNFQDIAKTVTIPANQTTANIFVNPINVSAIEASKTLAIALQAGTGYELSTPANVNITIVDNANPPSDAPEVSFGTSDFVTNPYMEEVKTITVGLSKTYASDLVIPLTIDGDLVADTDYEIAGLSNNAITIPAGSVSADFTVTMKNTAVVDMDKTVTFGFAAPSVTDYAVKATENTFAINAVDPQVDFSVWFNETNDYTGFREDNTTDTYVFKSNMAYWTKRYYWDSVAEDWKSLSRGNVLNVSETDGNQWTDVTNTFEHKVGGKFVYTTDFERTEYQGGDYLGLTKFFDNEAVYSSNSSQIKSETGWFRFAAKEVNATTGDVVVPAQTLTVYKANDIDAWKAKTYVDVDVNGEIKSKYYYWWYADSKLNGGDISKSSQVTPATITVERSVGTFNATSKEIIVDITFTCSDDDFEIDPKYYISNDGDTYTMRIKYINWK
ncbi:hypothetical protein [Marinifilum caeruleilacunae]|uniref:Calx-beta domain-containing protein n=1 Tax=Marinifilum caeruleilacunae TaxID=2499076 RepID=A0ABX1WRN1_9BACT|nr:hypothetical protein [Marinifilum caeruleilacunae]NOU58666.1 hypothetical protein [Marinifilum caeruleilacunae]